MEEKEKKDDRKSIIILIILFIIILLAYIISNILGEIGYVSTSGEETVLIDVTENDIGWDMLEELDIFRNKKYDNKNIIAPKSTGSYSFFVNNVTDQNLIYDLQLREINNYNINMKYRLKLENVYVAGSKDKWLDIEDVNLESIIITANSKNFYTLEWYWANKDVQDTEIGSLSYADYTLRIKLGAQIYDKDVDL